MPATLHSTLRAEDSPFQIRRELSSHDATDLARLGATYSPLRREISLRAWCTVPCWWSSAAWLEHVRLVYLRHYQLVRPALVQLTGGGVSLEAVLAVAATHAGVADHRTGRSSRPLVGATGSTVGLVVATGLAGRTVTRVRSFLRLVGLATEVAGGRRRTLAERMESWRRGDRARGWTADYALHPTRSHPVGEPTLCVVNRRRADGGPPRSGGLATTSTDFVVLSTTERHGKDQRTVQMGSDTVHGGLQLAKAWRRHPGAPPWVSSISSSAWSRLLSLPAGRGWTAEDLN